MEQEMLDYVHSLKQEFDNKPWKECYECHVAMRYPRYKNELRLTFNPEKKEMTYQYKDEEPVTL